VNWWVENQLRAALLTDLKSLIPEDYFELESNQLMVNKGLDKSGHLSKELSWGHAAGKLGLGIYFNNKAIITHRQLSAAEVLINIGMLVAAKAQQEACSNLKNYADALEVFDHNAGKISLQLKKEHIPQFELNLRGSLIQYVRHLSKEEAAPFLSLFQEQDLIELGLKVRIRDKVLSVLMKNLGTIIVTVVASVVSAALVFFLF
jgi:hypothetical protein